MTVPVTDCGGPQRPPLDRTLSGSELLRWYWLKDELTSFARALGVRTTGSKDILAARIAAQLDGATFEEPHRSKPVAAAQLKGRLTATTVIPRGQRCSQPVREWFVTQVGSSFGFDAAMRQFFADGDGTQTLQDALNHYRATRNGGPKTINAQFEYNRFTRSWHQANPNGTRTELLAAWRHYRATPADSRERA